MFKIWGQFDDLYLDRFLFNNDPETDCLFRYVATKFNWTRSVFEVERVNLALI